MVLSAPPAPRSSKSGYDMKPSTIAEIQDWLEQDEAVSRSHCAERLAKLLAALPEEEMVFFGASVDGERLDIRRRRAQPAHGSITGTPQPMKSATLRVITALAAWARAVAAIIASSTETGAPDASRSLRIAP